MSSVITKITEIKKKYIFPAISAIEFLLPLYKRIYLTIIIKDMKIESVVYFDPGPGSKGYIGL